MKYKKGQVVYYRSFVDNELYGGHITVDPIQAETADGKKLVFYGIYLIGKQKFIYAEESELYGTY